MRPSTTVSGIDRSKIRSRSVKRSIKKVKCNGMKIVESEKGEMSSDEMEKEKVGKKRGKVSQTKFRMKVPA